MENTEINFSSSPGIQRTKRLIDPYSPSMVDELLGDSEWKNLNYIIKLTFKSLVDCVKAQGETISELEKQMPTRVFRLSFISRPANTSCIAGWG
jgi:hypothetical protein